VKPTPVRRWPILFVIALFAVVTLVFLYELIRSSPTPNAQPEATLELTRSTYMNTVSALLNGADPAHGANLVEQYGCVACHRQGAANKMAPAFNGIAERAATRRPPLTAAAYIYESITNPSAFIAPGKYNAAMPENFRERLSDRELGDIIAFLLTPDAH
jgi:cytochrome c2